MSTDYQNEPTRAWGTREGKMGESKHTPGPWAIHHDGKPLFGYWHIRQDPKDWDGHGYQAICTLPASTKNTHYGEMFAANARLIAAAPDYDTAARKGRDALQAMIDLHGPDPAGMALAALNALDAAIAKAEAQP